MGASLPRRAREVEILELGLVTKAARHIIVSSVWWTISIPLLDYASKLVDNVPEQTCEDLRVQREEEAA